MALQYFEIRKCSFWLMLVFPLFGLNSLSDDSILCSFWADSISRSSTPFKMHHPKGKTWALHQISTLFKVEKKLQKEKNYHTAIAQVHNPFSKSMLNRKMVFRVTKSQSMKDKLLLFILYHMIILMWGGSFDPPWPPPDSPWQYIMCFRAGWVKWVKIPQRKRLQILLHLFFF